MTTLDFGGLDHRDPPRLAPVPEAEPGLAMVRRLIWLYFWLLIVEGALRKWIFPGLSNPLLLVRDPVVILIYLAAIAARAFPYNNILGFTAVLAVVNVVVSELFGDGNLLVTLFGFRTSFLHLPLIFVMQRAFTPRDVDKMAKWFILVSIPMCLLVLAQFRASPDHWLNNGVSGSQNGQLEVGQGRIRPPGTFSFTSILTIYLGALSGFAIYANIRPDREKGRLALIGLGTLAVMVAISGSRAAVGSVMLSVAALVLIAVRKPAFTGQWLRIAIGGGVLFVLLTSWSEFRQGLEIHHARFGDAQNIKEGFFLRAISDLLIPFRAAADAQFFGIGLGMGTNAASGLIHGRSAFSLGESDLARIVHESGPILGFAYIGLRVAILVHLTLASLRALDRNNPLPLLLLAPTAPLLFSGQFGVPSILGFSVFNAALCLAATNEEETPEDTGPEAPPPQRFAFEPEGTPRGRSNYAAELHGEVEDPITARYGP